jgi:alkylhydroperoxidase family enzyme
MVYSPPPDRDETTKAFKKRIYNALRTMERAAIGNKEMRIVKQWPQNDRDRVWRNLHTAWITDTLKSTWYNIIHDLIPTKERLAAIRLAASNQCDRCAKADTLIHRLTDCTPSADIWKWARSRLAAILRTDQQCIPNEWTTRHHFHLCPPQRHNATVWTIAHLVRYITNEHRLSLTDYIDFLRRARWKAYKMPRRMRIVGN